MLLYIIKLNCYNVCSFNISMPNKMTEDSAGLFDAKLNLESGLHLNKHKGNIRLMKHKTV